MLFAVVTRDGLDVVVAVEVQVGLFAVFHLGQQFCDSTSLLEGVLEYLVFGQVVLLGSLRGGHAAVSLHLAVPLLLIVQLLFLLQQSPDIFDWLQEGIHLFVQLYFGGELFAAFGLEGSFFL